MPDELKHRHTQIYAQAITSAKDKDWDPELGDDD